MQVDKLQFHPIRLRIERISNGRYKLYRGEQFLGEIEAQTGGWHVRSKWSASLVTSFRVAVLNLARFSGTGVKIQEDGNYPVVKHPQGLKSLRTSLWTKT